MANVNRTVVFSIDNSSYTYELTREEVALANQAWEEELNQDENVRKWQNGRELEQGELMTIEEVAIS
jgi:hypothetical protein